MAPLWAGIDCPHCSSFLPVAQVYDPVTDRHLDRIAEKRAVPQDCPHCSTDLARCLLQVQGREREGGVTQPGMRRSALGQGNGKPRPKEGPLSPSVWRRTIFSRQRLSPGSPALCAVTGEPLDEAIDDAHHPVEKRWLRAEGLHAYVWDPRNGMAIKKRVHEGQTSKMRPIPRETLPEGIYDFIAGLPGRYPEQARTRLHNDHPKTKGH